MSRGWPISVLVAGPAGAGVFATSMVIGKTLLRHGHNVFITNEYPSLIRGGHQWALVRSSPDEYIYSHRRSIDIVVALDKSSVGVHLNELSARGLVICDEADCGAISDHRVKSLPLRQILKELGGPPVALNTLASGVVFGILRASHEVLAGVIRDQFAAKEEIARLNIDLARRGYDLGVKLKGGEFPHLERREDNRGKLLIDGNSATALGALAGGMTFFTAYPMTPASPILHFLAEIQREYNLVVFQPESELAAINMAIGAAYAGARSMVATSGGGFSLMVEALGQAAMTETPIVIVNVQRPGPSTGLPTHTAQGDLRFVIHASQGEFPRVVLAPGDPYEAFLLSFKAMEIAWIFQIPVIILSDKFLGESYWTVEEFPKLTPSSGSVILGEVDAGYARYKITEDGVSPMALPGTRGALVYANTSEHDEYGQGSIDPRVVKAMQEKRFRKLSKLRALAEAEGVKTYGSGDRVVVTWGSTKMPVLEALKNVRDVEVVQVLWLEPFPVESLRRELSGKQFVVVENNMTGQLVSLIREKLLIEPDGFLGKYDGRQFVAEEIENFLREKGWAK
ncbi:2-oxoacid:acceptor oxidoreductase subunit alpha [Infirmifilum lucidum]|uniref:2-oxoacid oxidoreductase (ferredoxin) n=1 Tax=Infirmifilum lucidum TaxID=2776706 RepID=A0A7L9FKV9_9CREN|nr:2-oxoacid:acceptor oxidoreductase subunit alpha [Infirmifilum lucidum]QOJ79445.1 2-oxoacid:acceptor oxidoreductase subunit alpha [Infirmifilum lucidum]